MHYNNNKRRVWIIAVDADTSRYTPSLTPYRERSKWTSDKRFWFEYEDCLRECQIKNKKEKRF